MESPPNSMKEKRRGAANGKAAHVPIGGISESVLEPAVGGGGGSVSIAAGEVVSRGVISAAGGAGASATLLGKAHASWSGNVLQVGGYTPAAVETSAALAEAVKAGLSLRLGLAPAGDGEAGVVRVTVSATPAAGVSATPEDTDV